MADDKLDIKSRELTASQPRFRTLHERVLGKRPAASNVGEPPTTEVQHALASIEEVSQRLQESNQEAFADTIDHTIAEMRSLTTSLVYDVVGSHPAYAKGSSLLQAFDQKLERPDLQKLEAVSRIFVVNEQTAVEPDFIKSSLAEVEAAWQNERNFILFFKDRLDEKPDSAHTPDVVERLERLTDHARQHGEDGLEALARLIFPEWEAFRPRSEITSRDVLIPTEAPEMYPGLRGPESPPEFVRRVYGEWLGQGLTRAHIRKLDPVLSTAINNWLKKPGCDWPADVDLPTLKEQNDRLVEAMKNDQPANLTLRDARRLEGLLHTRRKAQNL